MTEDQYTDDSADVSQLETRIDELEATIRKMLPSRREALGMGVAGLAGASLMSGTASAGSAQVGTIGDNSNLVDLVAEDVTITDTLNTASISGAAAGEALLSDGSGNLTFGSGGGGILRNGSEIDYVALDVSNLPTQTGSGDVALVTALDAYVQDNPPSGTPFDITSSAFSVKTRISSQDSNSQGIHVSSDGKKLFEIGSGSNEIYQSDLSIPFDINSASFVTSISTQDTLPQEISFNDDGTKMYEVGDNSDLIYQSDLSAAFEISTASFQTQISTTGSEPQGLAFSNDGTKMYECGDNFSGNQWHEYTLSTAFDISSASLVRSVDPGGDTQKEGIALSSSGDKFIDITDGDNNINQYTLATPFDISTATFQTSINADSFRPRDIVYSPDGETLYELQGSSEQEIVQYTIVSGGWETF